MRLPIFPLRTVLFPTATLPLHVFEPRYREMIGRCLAHDETFGVALILEGEEAGEPATPYRVGAEAAIIASRRRPDGRYDIVVEGRRRFEILSLDQTRNLLRAEVRFLDEPEGPAAGELAETVAAVVGGLLESLQLPGHAVVDETWKALDPVALSYRVAATIPATESAKQDLLEMPDAASRLRREARLLMSIRRIGAKAGAA